MTARRIGRGFRTYGRWALASILLASASRLSAQTGPRPSLPNGADPNNWEAYYDAAVAALDNDVRGAEARFEWAAHLRPDRAEPYYGLWIAYWCRDFDRFPDYLSDDAKVLRDPAVRRADSLRAVALRRNPFVHQGLVLYLYNKLPGRFPDDQITRGWIALGQANLSLATQLFGKAIDRDPARYGYLRFVRASAFVNSRHVDSAAIDLRALLAQLRAEDAKRLGSEYESKELLEYAIGLIHWQTRNVSSAREAFGRAVAENAAFVPAHEMLGQVALAVRDTLTAIAEYSLAVETEPNDVEAHIGKGKALLQARRPAEAATEFRKAIALEPIYAEPPYQLGIALEASGDARGAIDAYTKFLTAAALSDTRRGDAQRRIQALGGHPPRRAARTATAERRQRRL